MRNFRKLPRFVAHLLAATFGLSMTGGAMAAGGSSMVVDGVKALVHDSVITKWEVDYRTFQAEPLLWRQYQNQPAVFDAKVEEVRSNNLAQLIDQQLILHEFQSMNIPAAVLDTEVDREMQNIIHAQYYGDRMRMIKSLQAEGMSLESFRQKVRDRIIISFLSQKNVVATYFMSPHKVEAYYLAHRDDYKMEDEVKLRMIVLKPEGETNTLKLAEEILEKVNAGAVFSEMAVVYSQGSQRKEGGDWGWWEHSRLNKGLADVAFGLGVGQRSPVLSRTPGDDFWMYQYENGQIKRGRHYAPDTKTKKESLVEERTFTDGVLPADLPSPIEYYLMLVEEKRSSHCKTLGEVRDEIEKNLLLEERSRLQKQWLNRLRKKTFVRYF